jgi:hypothetical protein
MIKLLLHAFSFDLKIHSWIPLFLDDATLHMASNRLTAL